MASCEEPRVRVSRDGVLCASAARKPAAPAEAVAFPPPPPSAGAPNTVPPNPRQSEMEGLACSLQDSICAALENVEGPTKGGGKRFKEDAWHRGSDGHGGGGRSRVLQGGRVFEKAGVNVSIVRGVLPPAAARQMRARGKAMGMRPGSDGLPFYAVGVSLVLHPRNPKAPTAHANFRMFEVREWDEEEGEERARWWYGGGADLTPAFLDEDDARHFHGTLKAACDRHGSELYPEFKRWCDRYFNNTHRASPGDDGERRGIGGVFFDDFGETSLPAKEAEAASAAGGGEAFAFVRDVGQSFLPAYLPVLVRHVGESFTPDDKRWQQIRRGRYVEFNLVHDRGTKFGLHTPGSRIESILVSLPETARWEYQAEEPPADSPAGRLMEALRRPRDWA